MPLATHTPTAKPVKENTLPRIQPNIPSVVVDKKQAGTNNLLTYISGSKWEVDFYGAIVTKNTDLSDLDPGRDPLYQQYYCVHDLVLKVSSALSNSYSQETGTDTVSGTALIPGFMTPNAGDLFIADSAGRKAIFRITEVDTATFNEDRVYEITYGMLGYVDTQQTLMASLKEKTHREYYYSYQRQISGQTPLLLKEEQESITKLYQLRHSMLVYFFDSFYSRQNGTLILPGQTDKIVDAYLTSFVLETVEQGPWLNLIRIQQPTSNSDPYLELPTIWTVLLNRDSSLLSYVIRSMGVLDKTAFNGQLTSGYTARYQNFDAMIYPSSEDELIKKNGYGVIKRTVPFTGLRPSSRTMDINAVLTKLNAGESIRPTTHPVTIDDTYVLSSNFYGSTLHMSILESCVSKYVNKEKQNISDLVTVSEEFRKWGAMEQFYYIPVLAVLIRECVHGI